MHHEAAKAVESAAVLMRIQILSDLHLEFQGNSLPSLARDAELIVLAGDLTPVPAGSARPRDAGPGPSASSTSRGTTSFAARRLTSHVARLLTTAGATR